MIGGLVHVAGLGALAAAGIVGFIVMEGRRLRKAERDIDPPFEALVLASQIHHSPAAGASAADATGRCGGVEPPARGSAAVSPPIAVQVRDAHLAHVRQVFDTDA